MSGTLYVVATPIGNLEDITLRALRILREVSVIAAEDTRRTAKLLTHHGIPTATVSFHEHNTRRQMPYLMRRLRQGESVAIVSDAGTPAISDPGLEIVQACIEAGIRVQAVPGPSAPLTALVASGFQPQPVTVLGFAPPGAIARTRWLRDVASIPHTVVFFEAPHRVAALLRDAAAILGNRPICLARELTKIHEDVIFGTAADLAESLNSPKGEITIVVAPAQEREAAEAQPPSAQTLMSEFGQLTESAGFSRRDAVAELARRYRRPAREIYAAIESAKHQ